MRSVKSSTVPAHSRQQTNRNSQQVRSPYTAQWEAASPPEVLRDRPSHKEMGRPHSAQSLGTLPSV